MNNRSLFKIHAAALAAMIFTFLTSALLAQDTLELNTVAGDISEAVGFEANPELSVAVTSNASWTWSSDSVWLTSDELELILEDNVYKYKVSENFSTVDERVGELTFITTNDFVTRKLTVTQAVSTATDTDGDTITDAGDPDDDNDLVLDEDDAFPLDPTEDTDTDGDGEGDNTDIDIDGDGVANGDDAFPFDPEENTDTDGDGIGDNGDLDADGDGVLNDDDAFPLDNTETTDTDGDGVGDNSDVDIDGDGIINGLDAFPLDPTETTDTDGDGLGNNIDTDDDNDGVADANDAFPLDPTETKDTDGDGTGDNADADIDGDGVVNGDDAFPLDPNEDTDTDGDGAGDNSDPDADGDGVLNGLDAFPLDPTEDTDTDGDGLGNNADTDDDNDNIADELFGIPLDLFPLDPFFMIVSFDPFDFSIPIKVLAHSFEEQTETVFVTTDSDWTWTSDADWLTGLNEDESQSASSGEPFTYQVTENQTGQTRTGTITFRTESFAPNFDPLSTGLSTITVTQVGNTNTVLFLSDNFQAVGGEQTTRTVEVFSITDWTWSLEDGAAGFILSDEEVSQSGDQTFTYQFTVNDTGLPREGKIVFTTLAGDIIAELDITQGASLSDLLILADNTQASSFSAQDVTVDVFSNTDWRWESDSDWLTSGEDLNKNGDLAFTYQVSVNDTGAARTGNLTFKTAAGDITAVLEVTQLSGSIFTLSLSDTQQANPFDALTRDVEVISNTSVLWESDQDWLGSTSAPVIPVDVSGQQTFTYTMSQNDTGEARTATLTFRTTAGGLIATLEVTQLGTFQPSLLAEEPVVFATEEGEGLGLNIRSNTTWTWVSSDPSWLNSGELLEQTGNRNGRDDFSVFAEPNITGEERSATITFTTLTGGLTATVEVIQGGQLRLSQTQQATDFSGGSRDVEVLAGVATTWLWASNAEWLTSTEGLTQTGSDTFTYDFSPNESGVARVGILTFTTAEGGITRTLEVTQLSGSTLDLDLSLTEQVVISTANAYDVDVESNTEWTWSSSVDWLTSTELLTQTNVGPAAFTYNARANNTTEDRIGTITFFTTSGGISKTLTVTQLRGDGLFLSLSSNQQANSSLAQSRSFEVFSNTEWTWESSDPDWLASTDGLTQNGDQTFNYEVSENATGETRVGTLTFTSTVGGIIAVMEVTQFGGTGTNLSLSESDRITGAAANATLTVDVSSNTDWLWSSNADWLTSGDAQEQNGDQTFGYEVSANDTGAQRTGTITFTSATGGLIATLDVTQLSVPGSSLSLSETALVTDFNDKTGLSVDVTSDTTWVWQSSDPTWLTASTEALTQTGNVTGFIYEVSENSTGANRTATLTFTSEAGDVSAVLEVTQLSGTGLTLNLSETERVTGAVANAGLTVDVSSNTDWLWSSNVDWLTSGDAQEQNGDQTFGYEVSANDTGAQRTGTITFTSATGGLIATLDVTQLSVPGSSLSLSETALVTDFNDKTGLSVDVTSDTTWVWQSSDPTWLTASTEALTQTGNVTGFIYEVSENSTGANRTATLTFTSEAGDVSAVLEVTQLSGTGLTLNLSETERVTGAAANATLTVDVSSNTDWLWSSNADWLTSGDAQEQNGDQTFGYEVSANDTGAQRVGVLTFRSATGGLVETLTVTQLSVPGSSLSLSETALVTDFNDKTGLSVDVTSDTTWVWQSSDPTWLTASTEALTQTGNVTGFIYEVSENSTGANRTATLTFTSEAGDVSAVLEVTQLSGTGLTLNLSETERVTGAAANATLTVDVSSNTDWLWSSNADWLTSGDAQEQNGDQTFGYEVSANDTGAQRTGTITFTSATGGLIATLDVTQLSAPGSTLSLSESVRLTDFSAKTVVGANVLTVDVISDPTTTWLWESDALWLTSPENQENTDSLSGFEYEVTENTTDETRTGTLTFTTQDLSVTVTLIVTQLSGTDETLTISETPRFSDFTNKDLTVDVSSNTEWLWSSDSGWLTSPEAPTQNDNVAGFKYNLALNDTGVDRTGTITFITESGRLVQTLTVTQLSNTGDFLILSDRLQASDFTAKTVVGNNARSVEVFSSLDVIWESNEDWLTSPAEATLTANPSGQTFTYELNENTTGQTREATITFRTNTGDITETLRVIQGGDVGDYLIASETQVTTDFNDKSISVDVFSGNEWTWEVNAEAREWLSSEEDRTQNEAGVPFEGSFDFKVATNNTEASREGTITFSSTTGNLEHVLTITQLSGSDFYLNLSQTSATYSFEATGLKTVVVDSNAEWTWRSTAGWLTSTALPTVTGTGPYTFDYSLAENTGLNAREARLQFFSTDGRLTAELVITQLANAGSVLALSEINHANSYLATPDGSPREFEVFSNRTWLWEVVDPADRDWLIVTEPLEQTGDQTFSYKVAENLDDQERDGDIKFTTINGDVSISINVRQLAGPGASGLAVSPSILDIGPADAVLSVDILSDRGWQWVSDDSWLSSEEAVTQSGSQEFTLRAAENLGGLARVGTLTFTTVDGALSTTLTVTQFASEDDDRDGLSNEEETKPFFVIEGSFTWGQARLDAIRRGGTLAVIEDANEHDEMTSVLPPLNSSLWIGASGATPIPGPITSVDFEWVDPLTSFNPLFADSKWNGQPDNSFGLAAVALQPDYTWNDVNEYTVLDGYILELPKTNPFNPNSLGDSRYLDGELWKDSDGDGLLGITEYELGTDPRTPDTDRDGLSDGEEYNPFEVVADLVTWEQARSNAQVVEGDTVSPYKGLAVINNEDILVRLMSVVGGRLENPLWIGASDLTGFDGFEWGTDPPTPLSYANWAENQPDSFFGAIAIELKTTFDWNDANITELKGYVLEREATGVLNPDSDSDGLSDGLEVNTYRTNPKNPDTDGDDLEDGAEIDAGTDPFNPDSDGDGLTDGDEVNTIDTDPLNPDSDGDGITDGDEVAGGSDPNDPNDPVDGGGGIDSGSGDPKRDPSFQTKITSLLRTDTVSLKELVADPFTPFGNGVRVVKFGDDGSQVVTDNSGILLWGRSVEDGYDYEPVEGSEQAEALYVSNTELILWTNSDEDFDKYDERNEAQVSIYRFADGTLAEPEPVEIKGKEILSTPSITTTSGSRVITTTERTQGARERDGANVIVDFYDNATLRTYLLTPTGVVKRTSTISERIPYEVDNYTQTQIGPDTKALAYGTDGSSLLKYSITDGKGNFRFSDDGIAIGEPIIESKYLWIDSDGAKKIVPIEPDATSSAVLFLSDERLVITVDSEIRDYRRSNDGDPQASSPAIIPLTTSGESVLDAGNLTIRGNVTYFYTTDGSFLRSYELTGSGVRNIGEVAVVVGVNNVAKINPQDGSAIIESESTSTPLIWVFPKAEEPADVSLRFLEVESSEEASAMLVTSDELIIWDNAYAPIPFGSGVPNGAVIKHIVRSDPDPDGDAPNFLDLEVTTLITEGIYVLNSPREVLPTDLWNFITAEKLPDPGDTALIRTYKLDSAPDLDTDGDGLLDRYETNTGIYVDSQDTGTDPEVSDTDGDGASDGDEVYPYYVVTDSFAYKDAVSDAQKTSATGNVYRHLAVINSKRELNEFQYRFGKSLPATYWIGLNDGGVEGVFQWVETSPPDVEFTGIPGAQESFDFANWDAGQPNNLNGADAVVVNKNFTWKTEVNENPLGYILQVQRTDPNNADTDGDGLSDGVEINNTLTDPNNQDTDGDDGAVITYIVDGQLLGTAILDGKDAVDPDPLDNSNPTSTDQDGDGLTDAVELLITKTLVDNPDSDGDGLSDGVETGIGNNAGNFVDKNNTGTDPNNSDSDGDGVDDGDELFNGTDPNKDSYEIADEDSVKPGKGTYTGLVLREFDSKPIGDMKIKVTRGDDGVFYLSGSLRAFNQPSSKFTGRFTNRRYSDIIYNFDGAQSNIDLAMTKVRGRRVIGGTLEAPNGDTQRFNLAKPYYKKSSPAGKWLKRKYTYLIPSESVDSLSMPAGDGIGYGKIRADGRSKIMGWSNAGYRFTFARRLQNGDANADSGTLPFYTQTSKRNNGSEWITGTIKYNVPSPQNQSVVGKLRYVKPSTNSRFYAAGFDKDLEMEGYIYRKNLYAGIPASNFEVFANNARGLFEGGLPNGAQYNPYIFSWESDGDMLAPLNFTYYIEGRYRKGAGYFTGNYIDQAIGQQAEVRGVLLQRAKTGILDLVSGHGVSEAFGVTVRHGVEPNDTGDVAPSASIAPASKSFDNDFLGQSLGGIYQVNIEISPNSIIQNWTVDIPAEVDWITADVLSGSGSAAITITVSENRTLFNREAVIQIGGLNHRITQERRTAN